MHNACSKECSDDRVHHSEPLIEPILAYEERCMGTQTAHSHDLQGGQLDEAVWQAPIQAHAIQVPAQPSLSLLGIPPLLSYKCSPVPAKLHADSRCFTMLVIWDCQQDKSKQPYSEVTRCPPLTTEQVMPTQVPVHGLLPCQLARAGGLPKAAGSFCSAEPACMQETSHWLPGSLTARNMK